MTSRSTGLALAILAGAVTSCVEPGPEDPPRAPSPEGPCDRADFNFAPAPRDGTAVGRIAPIDISDLQAEVTVAVADAALHVAATLDFVAPPDGRPVLQFHPTADALLLDGDAIALIPLLVSTPARALVALPDLEPCSAHTLTMQYSVPESALADAPLPTLEFEAGTVWWSSAQDDGVPNAMLERMLPSNLLFDRHPITLDVTLDGAGEDHALVANGLVEERDTGWLVTLPSRQPHGSFWVLYPTAGVSRLDRVVALPGERDVTVELYAFDADAEVDLTANADLAEATLLEYDETLGPYLHGDRYLGWLRSDLSVSMEYEGATLSTPGALQHEMAHSWYARGIAPVSEFHGWIDEGMAWRLEIEDNGIGIEDAYLDQIFDLFTRLNHVDEYPGSGTGLNLARRIIEDHRGTLRALPGGDEGTTFVVTLPKDPAFLTQPGFQAGNAPGP